MPQISIVLPVYNVERYLEATLDSILSQSYTDFEIVCVDDGSTDRSPSILESYSLKDPRLTIVRQANAGPGASRNTGLDHATGKYVIMLDADDIYHPHLLELMHSKATELDLDIVACESTRFDDQTGQDLDSWWTLNKAQLPSFEPFSCRDMPDYVFTAFMGWPWDKLYKRSFIEANHLRYPELTNSEDLYFVFLSLAKAQRIGIVEKTLIKHRDNRSGSVSRSRANDPLSFYTSTCLLKNELKKDPILYEKLSWGFLNWAFGYMVWNIETMTDPAAQKQQLAALRSGEFTELEIEARSPRFFALDPGIYNRYVNLLNDSLDAWAPEDGSLGHHLLAKVLHFLQRFYDEGFSSTIQAYFTALKYKILRTDAPILEPDVQRGSDFISTALATESQHKGARR